MIENTDVEEIQINIKHQIEQLEEKVKNSKAYWNSNNLNFDKQFLQNFIEGHYNEMVHHLNQIKYHLEKVGHHKTAVEDIQVCLVQKTDLSSPDILNDSNEPFEGKAVKRKEEEKIRFKSRRLARSTSLKYVLQWEKLLDEQKEENSFNSVKRRLRNSANGDDTENAPSEEADISKIMVKNRVLQFEGIQKPKRISSTYETFLDFSGDKPKRINSYPILEDIEDDDEPERPRSCTLNDKTSKTENTESSPDDCSKVPEDTKELKITDNSKEQNIQSNESHIKHSENQAGAKIINEVTQEEQSNNREFLKEESPLSENPIISESNSRKPRIVEVHLKQQFITDVNSQVPPV